MPRIMKKTCTYSIMHMVVAFLVAWAVSRNLTIALGISLIEPLVQTVFYNLHERLWAKAPPEENIEVGCAHGISCAHGHKHTA